MTVIPSSDSPDENIRGAAPAGYYSPPPPPTQHGFLPTAPIIDKKSYAAALSYVGSARRISGWIKRTGSQGVGMAIVAWTFGLIAIAAAWTFVTCWYIVVLGIFGIFTIPYRLIRRSQRKSQHLQQTQLATMQAMMLNQQQAIIQNSQPRD